MNALEQGKRLAKEIEGQPRHRLHWQLGDWFASLPDGEGITICRDLGLDADKASHCGYVAETFPPAERIPALSYSHHAAVIHYGWDLPDGGLGEKKALLQEAIDNKWNASRLTREAKARNRKRLEEKYPPPPHQPTRRERVHAMFEKFRSTYTLNPSVYKLIDMFAIAKSLEFDGEKNRPATAFSLDVEPPTKLVIRPKIDPAPGGWVVHHIKYELICAFTPEGESIHGNAISGRILPDGTLTFSRLWLDNPERSHKLVGEVANTLNAVANNPQELILRRSGRCIWCNTTMTDDLSLARGIGPECFKHKVAVKFVEDLSSGTIDDVITKMTSSPRV